MATTMRSAGASADEIKCAQCGAAIAIAHAADHICRTASPGPMHPMDRFNLAFSSMKTKTNAPFPFDVRRKPTPAGIDTAAANKSIQPRPLSPSLNRPVQPSPLPPTTADPSLPPGPLVPASSRLPSAPFCMPPRAATTSPRFPPSRSGTPLGTRAEEPQRSASPPQMLGLPPGLPPPADDDLPRAESPPPLDVEAIPHGLRPPFPTGQSRSGSHAPTPSSQMHPPNSVADFHRPLHLPSESSAGPAPGMAARAQTPDEGAPPPVPLYSARRPSVAGRRLDGMRIPFASPQEGLERQLQRSPDRSPEPANSSISSTRSLGHFRKPSMSAASRPLHEIGCIKTHRPTLSRSVSPPKTPGGTELAGPWSATVVDARSDARLENAPPVPLTALGRFLQADSEPTARSYNAPNEIVPFRPPPDSNGGFSHSPTESVSSNDSASPASSRSSPPTSAASLAPAQPVFKAPGFKAHAPPPLTIRTGARDFVPARLSPRTAPALDVPGPLSPRSGRLARSPLQQDFEPRRSPAFESDREPRSAPLQEPLRDPALSTTQQPFPESMHSPTVADFHQPRSLRQDAFHESLRSPVEDAGHNPRSALQQAFPEIASQPMPGPPQSTMASRRRPVKSFSRPNYSRPQTEPESPMDPALHNGRLPSPIDTTRRPPPPSLPSPPAFTPGPLRSPRTAPIGGSLPRDAFPPRSASHGAPARALPHRSATTGSRGPLGPSRGACRGCRAAIRGKAVSAGDGRLTGRWHRACFVCTTCAAPFATQDFYVFGNAPYCARHYHLLNRTLCTGCDGGIEGTYVETERTGKFHPGCFCCRRCCVRLGEVHFEDPVSGDALCERHAVEAVQMLGPKGRFPERRTTRLMML